MAETTPPPSGPLAGASGRELRELQQFLLYPGSALTAAGEAVTMLLWVLAPSVLLSQEEATT